MRKYLQILGRVGITDDDQIETKLAKFATNICLFTVFLLSLFYAVFGSALSGSLDFALVSFGVAIGYGISFGLNGLGLFDFSRYLFLVIGCIHFFLLNLMVGPWQGAEYTAFILFIFPPLMFERTEISKLVGTLAGVTAATILALWLAQEYGPTLNISPVNYQIGYYVNIVFLSIITVTIVRLLNARMMHSYSALETERQKIDSILNEMMPKSILAKIDAGEQSIARSHSDAAILFADIVGFTELTRRISPGHLIELLDDLFAAFDDLANQHGIEKIKTIGDAYMAATGVDTDKQGNVENLFEFATAMIEVCRDISVRHGFDLNLRIGISNGHVISGIIGKSKKSFDLWGDTVNLASRLESSGEPGRIVVSEAVYWRLKDSWHFDKRDEIQLKGIGSVTTFIHSDPERPDNTIDFGKARVRR